RTAWASATAFWRRAAWSCSPVTWMLTTASGQHATSLPCTRMATVCHAQTAVVPTPLTSSWLASLGRPSFWTAQACAPRPSAGMPTVTSALVPLSTCVPQKQNLPSPVPARTALPSTFSTSLGPRSSHTGFEGADAGGPCTTAVVTVGTVWGGPPAGTPLVRLASPAEPQAPSHSAATTIKVDGPDAFIPLHF